jgi:hypothetical protein
MKNLIRLFLIALLFGTASVQAEEAVGKVGYMSGALVAQRSDGTMKILAPKSAVHEGDLLITAKDSYAQVQMNDGARMTLRPDSNLKIESYHFNEAAPQADNLALRLLKGGFRTLTGLIGKRGNPDAYRVRAVSTTIGIRGTDYSTRLCASKGCQDEDAGESKPATQTSAAPVVGRVMVVQGELTAKDKEGKERKLISGLPVYEGDTLATGKQSHGIVAFRDEGRITLQADTHFLIEKFRYDKTANEESAALRLLKGGVRVVTGLIGRFTHNNYQFKVSSATIGIRGTGFDAWCNGSCAEGLGSTASADKPLDGLGVYVWAGSVELGSNCASGTCANAQLVTLQQAAIIAGGTGKPELIKVIPPAISNNPAPMPDKIPVDMQKLFGSESSGDAPGLYVSVHEGHVILTQADKSLDLYRSESAFASSTALTLLPKAPAFMGNDTPPEGGANSSSSNPSTSSGCLVK